MDAGERPQSGQAGRTQLTVHTHGHEGPDVIVLHGGPGAAGSAAPLAAGLATQFRVLEPWQRGSGATPLTVAGHITDLHALIQGRFPRSPPALVGESWGAMLALAYAAAYPHEAGPLVLVGCGTFDATARAELQRALDDRLDPERRRRLARLDAEYPDPAQRLRQLYALTRPLYDYAPVPEPQAAVPQHALDIKGHRESWEDMVRLQNNGVYPAAFAAIHSPVLMLHGTWDPHPGRLIRAILKPYLPQLQYREWERCGHRPWAETHAREDFFRVLHTWLRRRCRGTTGTKQS